MTAPAPMPAKPVLCVSLGTAPAVVPEAFLLPGVTFDAVHVLTTETTDVSLVKTFFARHAPNTRLTLCRVAGFREFTSEHDHFQFEEVLYRWMLETAAHPDERYVCLSGGYKTMSAAMQKAAAVLGANQVFHVLADDRPVRPGSKPSLPTTIEQILQARDHRRLHWIRLGPESGWPQLRNAHPPEYPLETVRDADGVRWVRAADLRFGERLGELVERSQRIAAVWPQLDQLPFADLATWSQADLDWLHAPVDPRADRSWAEALREVELHCHLGGFATHGTDLAEIRAAADTPGCLPQLAEPVLPPLWPEPRQPMPLEAYVKLGDATGSALLKDAGCLRRQCQLLYQHLCGHRVRYAEIRCSPANYASEQHHRSPWQVLCDIRDQFQACMNQVAAEASPHSPLHWRCHVNLILIATRKQAGDYRTAIARHLALAVTAAEHWTDPQSCRVVGVDLAGYEDVTTRAHYFREEFTAVHRCGLALTVHAGENDDAEGIWRAVFDLNARRLGHALSLAQSPELLRSVADRGIGLEMCPYANLQIRGFPLEANVHSTPEKLRYPLLRYLQAGARVTVNTDNIGISAASLTDNLLLAARLCPGLRRLDWLRIQRHALETAFLPAPQRADLAAAYAAAIPRP